MPLRFDKNTHRICITHWDFIPEKKWKIQMKYLITLKIILHFFIVLFTWLRMTLVYTIRCKNKFLRRLQNRRSCLKRTRKWIMRSNIQINNTVWLDKAVCEYMHPNSIFQILFEPSKRRIFLSEMDLKKYDLPPKPNARRSPKQQSGNSQASLNSETTRAHLRAVASMYLSVRGIASKDEMRPKDEKRPKDPRVEERKRRIALLFARVEGRLTRAAGVALIAGGVRRDRNLGVVR